MNGLRLFFLATFFFVLFSRLSVFGQQEFKLNGVVIDKETNNRIALGNVDNMRNHYGVGSNDMGVFQIKAAIGDTILITKRGFNDLIVVVKSTADLVLNLNRGVTLNEVLVTGQNKKQALDEAVRDFRNKGTFYAGKPPAKLLSPFGGSPLTFFYELFGKTPRDARRFSKYRQTELEESYVDRFFNKSLITQNVGLIGKELEDFMINYRPNYKMVKNWTNYDAVKWITDCYDKYKYKRNR